MHRSVVLALVLTGWGAVLAAAAAEGGAARLEDLAWMAGSWAVEEGDTRSEEHWTRPAGGLMLGVHRDVRGERARFEFLRIVAGEDGIVYLASPQGREPTPFPLAESSPGRAVFANPDHDFPQRILYWRAGEDLCAAVEGTLDGREARQEWCWGPSGL
jgi:hypothetical protein